MGEGGFCAAPLCRAGARARHDESEGSFRRGRHSQLRGGGEEALGHPSFCPARSFDEEGALAHVFAAGGTPSESERPLSIGGYDRISDSVFDAYDYAALGHLHRHQRTQKQSERVQYSGSLMRYSFDEAEQHKGVIVGTIGEDGSVETDFRELAPLHQVRVLEGTFAELMSEKREASEDYLQVILTDELPVIDAMPKLREKYKNALGVEQNMGYKEDSGRRDIELEHMSDQDIFRAFVSEFRERELSDKEEALANVCWEAVYKKEEER